MTAIGSSFFHQFGSNSPAGAYLGNDPGLSMDFISNQMLIRDPNVPANNYSGTITQAIANGLITSTRGSIATYYDVNGILQQAANNVVRFDYDPLTHQPRGLLSEAPITNFIVWSNDFTNAAWNTKTNVTLTAAAEIGPDGTMSATKVEATTSSNAILANTCATAGNILGNTGSVYLKKGSGATVGNRVYLYNETTSQSLALTTINFDTGILTTTIGTATVEILPNGWYRIAVTAVAGISANDTIRLYVGFTSNIAVAGDFSYAYGAQVERGVYATSYVPSTSSAGTRSADNIDIDVTKFPFNPMAGTVFSRSRNVKLPDQLVAGPMAFYPAGVDITLLRQYFYNNGSNYRIGSNCNLSSVSQWDLNNINNNKDGSPNSYNKNVLAWETNNVAVAVNGGTAVIDLSATIPTGLTHMAIARGNRTSHHLNGHLSHLVYWPVRRTNNEIVALSTLSNYTNMIGLINKGTDGFWYDASRTDMTFQDNMALTPATAITDPVGIFYDKSKWVTPTYSVEGQPDILVNGDFNGSTGWTTLNTDSTHIITFGADSVRYQSDTTSPVLTLRQASPMTTGKFYEVETTTSSYTSGSIKIDDGLGPTVIANGVGVRRVTSKAISTTLTIVRNSTNVDLTLTKIRMREILGSHAGQNAATPTLRPTRQAGGLIRFDGIDDYLTQPATGALTGTFLTKVKFNAVNSFIMGAQTQLTTGRLVLGITSGGVAAARVGSTSIDSTIVITSTTGVLGLTWDGSYGTLYWNGNIVAGPFYYATDTPDTVLPIFVGGINSIGSPAGYANADLYHSIYVKAYSATPEEMYEASAYLTAN